MLYEVLDHLHNFFAVRGQALTGRITITDTGEITPQLSLLDGQYYLISGSVLNDGVYCYNDSKPTTLNAETFDGIISPLAIPKTVLLLVDEISAWQEKNGTPSVYQSESFGGYTYSRATNSNGGTYTWQDAFKSRLDPWRKMA